MRGRNLFLRDCFISGGYAENILWGSVSLLGESGPFLFTPLSIKRYVARICGDGATFVLVIAKP